MITFNCIYAPQALTVRRFLKTVDIDVDDVINYMEITNKLTKNDIYSHEPSDVVVNSYIIKHLEKSILEKHNKSFYYVMSTLDEDVIINLQDHIYMLGDTIGEEVQFNAYFKDSENYNSVFRFFESINEINEK